MKKPLLMHVPVPFVFIITYLIGVAVQALFPVPLSPTARTPTNIAGWILMLVGVSFAVWAQVIFRRLGTTTVPGQASSTLVTWGPYRFSRNPMYVALTLMYLGEAGIVGQLWPVPLLVLVLIYLNWTLIPFEEAHLRETFGETYQSYHALVRRWF